MSEKVKQLPVTPQVQQTFNVKKRLTVPIISMAHTEQVFAEVLSPIEVRVIEGFGKGADGQVELLRIKNLQDNQEYDLVVSAVIKSTLVQEKEYVGHKYLFKAGVQVAGKKYRPVDIFELEEQA